MKYVKWRLAQLVGLAVAFRYAWRRTWRVGLGDVVISKGRRLQIINGVTAPSWDVIDIDTREALRCHERDMRKERTPWNYLGSFRNGWRFWMGYWFAIDVGKRLGFNGAYYGTDGYLARRQRRLDRKYTRAANARLAAREAREASRG